MTLPNSVKMCHELAALMDAQTISQGNGIHPTAIRQLDFIREDSVAAPMHGVYRPVLCIIVQGKKEVSPNEKIYLCSAAQSVIISVDLPIGGYVVEATPDKPYLSLTLSLDTAELCDIITQTKSTTAAIKAPCVNGLLLADADSALLACALRLTHLLNNPQDISFLAPMIVREMYYRLLIGKQGNAVRQIATSGSNMQRIAETIKLIKTAFNQPLQMEDLAEQANMSLSSFHRHFKAVTSLSPLQYQKRLRLLKARQLMLTENADAMSSAYQVGYESPSQFSREYSRMFGAPPIKDIESLRIA